MKKIKFFYIFLCLAPFFGLGQTRKFDFIGTLHTENEVLISIKLNFEVLANDSIKGTSTTDFYGDNRTVSTIKGVLNQERQLLSFKETANINTKAQATADRFCYISVVDLPIRVNKRKNIVQGAFKGFFPNGEACAEGEIYLVGADILAQIAAELDPLLDSNLSARKNQVLDSILPQKAANANPKSETVLTHEGVIQLPWTGNTVKLIFWDGYKEDNDRINIYVNGELKEQSIEVKERKKTLLIPLETDICTIKIEAENEGKSPPNTVQLQLVDEGKLYPLVTQLKKGQHVEVTLTKHK